MSAFDVRAPTLCDAGAMGPRLAREAFPYSGEPL